MLTRIGLVVAIAGLLLMPARALAEEPKNRGLFITPLRSYLNVQPGKLASNTFTVANITDRPATISLSIEQFSVADYTYDYQFDQVREDWVRLGKTQLTLSPNKSETVTYTVAAPADATPGGHYFSLFATASLEGQPNEVRAATILYLTVDGELHKSSEVTRHNISPVSFGTDLEFNLDVKNTGNTHFFTYVSGELQGLSAKSERPEITSLLMPGKSRVIGSTIPAPLLPGVYKAAYGYKTDDGQDVRREAFVLYVPPWSLLIPIGGAWIFFAIRRYRAKRT